MVTRAMVIFELTKHGYDPDAAAHLVDDQFSAVVDNAIQSMADLSFIVNKVLELNHHECGPNCTKDEF